MTHLTITPSTLPDLSVSQIAALSQQELQEFDISLAILASWVKVSRDRMNAALEQRYGEQARTGLLESGRDFGVMHLSDGDLRVTVPDSVHVMTQYGQSGASGLYHFSGVTLTGPGKQVHLYGALGTIKVIFGEHDQVFVSRMGDKELRQITIPAEDLGSWRVEAEFVGAIRGEEAVKRNDFATGLRDLEFTEAVARSATNSRSIMLPLVD